MISRKRPLYFRRLNLQVPKCDVNCNSPAPALPYITQKEVFPPLSFVIAAGMVISSLPHVVKLECFETDAICEPHEQQVYVDFSSPIFLSDRWYRCSLLFNPRSISQDAFELPCVFAFDSIGCLRICEPHELHWCLQQCSRSCAHSSR